jgi:hypothetical protein
MKRRNALERKRKPQIIKAHIMFWTKPSAGALNALLVEHDLGLTQLVPENPFAKTLGDGVISAMRAGVRGRFDQQHWINTFNHCDRVVQLNIVALGFNEINMPPSLRSEQWRPVSNPFVLSISISDLDKARSFFQRRYGGSWPLSNGRLAILDWGTADLGSP